MIFFVRHDTFRKRATWRGRNLVLSGKVVEEWETETVYFLGFPIYRRAVMKERVPDRSR